MKKLISAALLLCACAGTRPPAPAPAVTETTSATATASGRDLQFDRTVLDPAANACTDFYQYVNGGWLAKNPIPPQYTAWGYSSILAEENRKILREVLEAAAAKPASQRTPNEQKIGDYWASCMDTDAMDRAGVGPIQGELDRIEAINSVPALQAQLARLHTYDFSVPWAIGPTNDAKNSEEVIAEIFQGGLGLPDRDYYFKTDDRSKQIRDEYVKHVARLLELAGATPSAAADQAATILKFETAMAEASMRVVEMRDPNAIYNRMTLAQLGQTAPAIDWPTYFHQIGRPDIQSVNVGQPKFLATVSQMMATTPLDQWKTYLRWALLTRTAGTLARPFDEENFRFRNAFILGQKKQQDRWQRCVASANGQIGEALAQAWLERKFSPQAKQRATELVDNLIAALRDNLQTADWMSDATRQQALTKLGTFVRKIGYPDEWRDYSALQIVRGPHGANVLAANRFEQQRALKKIGQPVDRMEWYMTPPTFNAYYNPSQNEIVFPAGILQWPMFDVDQDDAFNYGAIGSVIGHEITHGFDDEGSQFDERGNLRNWWTPEDRKRFEERAECIIKQFDKYEIEPGVAHSGKLVAGESIADLGGLVIAWEGWQKSLQGKPRPPVVDGFTAEQRFFLGFARARASNVTPEALRLRIATDPHPANKFRVNGPLANMPEFANAFQCKAGDAMVRQERCDIW